MNNRLLSELYVHHNEWIKIVRSFGEKTYHEDLVQEMYIKISTLNNTERFYRNGVIYKGFIWIILRNMYYDFHKSKQRIEKVNLTEAMQVPDYTEGYEKTNAKILLENKITSTVKTWEWYDQMLFNLYRNSNLSIRKIGKETGISFKSIWVTLNNCKKSIKENVGEDYEDYINKEYELIK